MQEEGLYQDCSAVAVKRVLARQLAAEMKQRKITKTEMANRMQANRMQTNRAQLNRLLDPEKTGVSIDTIQRAAAVVGRQLRIELI